MLLPESLRKVSEPRFQDLDTNLIYIEKVPFVAEIDPNNPKNDLEIYLFSKLFCYPIEKAASNMNVAKEKIVEIGKEMAEALEHLLNEFEDIFDNKDDKNDKKEDMANNKRNWNDMNNVNKLDAWFEEFSKAFGDYFMWVKKVFSEGKVKDQLRPFILSEFFLRTALFSLNVPFQILSHNNLFLPVFLEYSSFCRDSKDMFRNFEKSKVFSSQPRFFSRYAFEMEKEHEFLSAHRIFCSGYRNPAISRTEIDREYGNFFQRMVLRVEREARSSEIVNPKFINDKLHYAINYVKSEYSEPQPLEDAIFNSCFDITLDFNITPEGKLIINNLNEMKNQPVTITENITEGYFTNEKVPEKNNELQRRSCSGLLDIKNNKEINDNNIQNKTENKIRADSNIDNYVKNVPKTTVKKEKFNSINNIYTEPPKNKIDTSMEDIQTNGYTVSPPCLLEVGKQLCYIYNIITNFLNSNDEKFRQNQIEMFQSDKDNQKKLPFSCFYGDRQMMIEENIKEIERIKSGNINTVVIDNSFNNVNPKISPNMSNININIDRTTYNPEIKNTILKSKIKQQRKTHSFQVVTSETLNEAVGILKIEENQPLNLAKKGKDKKDMGTFKEIKEPELKLIDKNCTKVIPSVNYLLLEARFLERKYIDALENRKAEIKNKIKSGRISLVDTNNLLASPINDLSSTNKSIKQSILKNKNDQLDGSQNDYNEQNNSNNSNNIINPESNDKKVSFSGDIKLIALSPRFSNLTEEEKKEIFMGHMVKFGNKNGEVVIHSNFKKVDLAKRNGLRVNKDLGEEDELNTLTKINKKIEEENAEMIADIERNQIGINSKHQKQHQAKAKKKGKKVNKELEKFLDELDLGIVNKKYEYKEEINTNNILNNGNNINNINTKVAAKKSILNDNNNVNLKVKKSKTKKTGLKTFDKLNELFG